MYQKSIISPESTHSSSTFCHDIVCRHFTHHLKLPNFEEKKERQAGRQVENWKMENSVELYRFRTWNWNMTYVNY